MRKILVCSLDWGLGHATRCIPVIREMAKRGVQIFIASSGEALSLLKQEFPHLPAFELPPYRPVYPVSGSMMFSMMRQAPKFRKVIHEEYELTEGLIKQQDIDIVVSDNRYGCYSPKIKSIIITHQINPLMPSGFGWMSPWFDWIMSQYIMKFNEVWIPDTPGSGLTDPFLSGKTREFKYIGWLSRFSSQAIKLEKKYEVMAVVSGPEPQRSIFRDLLFAQLQQSDLRSLLVTGEPGDPVVRRTGMVDIYNHLSGDEMETAMRSSGIIISRSGYSTVMDLMAIGGKAIFIPTPQQTEQYFLAEYFKSRQIAYRCDQASFSLAKSLEESKKFTGFSGYFMDGKYLGNALDNLLK